ncbi:MAG: bifunctional 4-hydroxy-3-methylbut-2-enyl diphosphate reductase/30S ribosomal protein S1 [Eubacterium sp.]|nr:bifunctional 4-hydroxy-3-methylbut-2-enyl diphosphate reductase/30S ribosomal protein S1 [Eubacterium sp.]
MREIIRAPHSGFCFGVKQAIETAEREAENSEKDIYTFGPLIHNTGVTDELEKKGIFIIDSLDNIEPGSKVIIRSHGIGKWFYDEAESKGIEVIDATCPYVKRIHQLVFDAKAEGKQVVIVGDKNHPEVKGINGWCQDSAIILNEPEVIKAENIFAVAQTTIRKDLFDSVIALIEENNENVEVNNTICSATSKRQEGCKETAEQVEVMLVVGDQKSSNTKKLYEIAKKYCENTYFVDDISNLPLKETEKYNKIGVAAGASTPENAIKEVTAKMSDTIIREESMLDFMEEIEKSLRLPRGGELVTGKVHQVTEKEIIVNLGCKKDGIIPLSEITVEGDQKLTDLFAEGEEITAKVLKTDDGDGTILLSKKKLEATEHWEEINKAFEDKTLIDVNVVRQVNGGVIAAYKEVQGFIPLSQLSDKFVENPAEFVGQTLTVKVSRVDARRGKAVFSHKAKLVEERQKALEEVWSNINVGDIVEGKVMRFTDYGAFVDIGGVDGLLHISEISWGKLKHPQEVLEIGQVVNVKILSMNTEKGKVSLGLKQTTPEPWTVIDENYQVGQVVKGKVVQIKEYGCFVELEPGLDGLVHISEVSHKRVSNINDELKVGDEVEAKILEIDKDRKRISLSIKETLEAPVAEEVAETEE